MLHAVAARRRTPTGVTERRCGTAAARKPAASVRRPRGSASAPGSATARWAAATSAASPAQRPGHARRALASRASASASRGSRRAKRSLSARMACGAVIVAPRLAAAAGELARHLHEGVDLGGDAAEGPVQAVGAGRPATRRRAPRPRRGPPHGARRRPTPRSGRCRRRRAPGRSRCSSRPGGTWPPMRSEPRTAPSASPRSSCSRPTVTPSAQSDGTPSRDARTSTRPPGRGARRAVADPVGRHVAPDAEEGARLDVRAGRRGRRRRIQVMGERSRRFIGAAA